MKVKQWIKLQEKKLSQDISDNFLFQSENVYVMDNHRLALWSWFQQMKPGKKYNLFHIDAHPDLSSSGVSFYNRNLNPLEKMPLDIYRTIIQTDINIPLFRWDNYIQFLLVHYNEYLNIDSSISVTHKLGSSLGLKNDFSSIHLLRELSDILLQKRFVNEDKWIINLDIDYFYSSQPQKLIMYSEEFILNIAEIIKTGLDNKMIEVLTIAFSPECCGSWENAEKVFAILNQKLDLKLDL